SRDTPECLVLDCLWACRTGVPSCTCLPAFRKNNLKKNDGSGTRCCTVCSDVQFEAPERNGLSKCWDYSAPGRDNINTQAWSCSLGSFCGMGCLGDFFEALLLQPSADVFVFRSFRGAYHV